MLVKKKALPLLVLTCLSSCGVRTISTSSSEISSTAEEISSSQEESVSSIDSSSSEESSSISSYESSSSEESSSSSILPSVETFDFYCVNDFHGAVKERYNGSLYEAGIAKYFGKLKKLKEADPEHVILLSSGDMWQGSLESNSNYGNLVTKAMNITGFDAMALGNHEFDYGQDKIFENEGLASFPFLAGNIVKHGDKSNWNENIKKSIVLNRGNAKIGIVGMIGEGQTTSITSKYVEDLDFLSPNEIAKEEAIRLRSEDNCDIVIYLLHDDMSSCSNKVANKIYFDGVFNAHTHSLNDSLVNNVPFMQAYCNGEAISHFKLELNKGKANFVSNEIINSSSSFEEDEELIALRDSYIEESSFKEKAEAVAGYVNGTLAAKTGVPNIAVKAMYEKYKPLHEDLYCAIENGQRASLKGYITYSDIFKATPFMNKIVIAKITGEDLINESKYVRLYKGDNVSPTEEGEYLVACIDFLLYHQNEDKVYDYYPCLNGQLEERIIAEYDAYPYDLTFDYIKDDLGGQVNPSDFLNTCEGFTL